jgi:membrane protease YdiL (CAAX protease family)
MPSTLIASISTQSQSQTSITPWWGAWSAFLIVGCFYLTQALGIAMVQMVAGFSALDQAWLLPLSLLLGTVGAGMVSWRVAIHRAKVYMDSDWFWELLGKTYDLRRLWRFVLLGVALGFGFFALTEYGVPPSEDLPQPLFDAMLSAPLVLKIGWVLMFVILFPFVEECLFRGFLFTGLLQSWRPVVAGSVTTVLFVAVHMPKVLEYWPALLAVTLMGTLTILIRIRTGSLAPGIAMHGTYNGTLVAAAFFSQPGS